VEPDSEELDLEPKYLKPLLNKITLNPLKKNIKIKLLKWKIWDSPIKMLIFKP